MFGAGDGKAGHRRSISISVLIALVVIALLMLPRPSGAGLQTIADWHDQAVFLDAVVQSETGLPEPGLQAKVGPAYIALTRAIAQISSLGAAEALIVLSRLTLLVCIAVLMTVALRDRSQTGIAFQLLLAAVAVFSLITSVWYFFSDIPWTHYVAAALLGGIVLTSLSGARVALRSALVGALAITLVQTRLFEAMVAGIAALVIAPVGIVRYWSRRAEWMTLVRGMLLPCVAGAVAGFVLIGWLSHNWSIYQQYSSEEAMVVTLQMLPTKAIQLFWDTCYATLCSVAEAPRTNYFADSFNSWRQPLLLQLPGLFGAAAGLLLLMALRPDQILGLPLGIMFAVVTAGGLIVAYTSGAPSGSPHLKYGFFRDFMPALILLTTAFIAALARQRALERSSTTTLVPLIAFFAVVVGLTALRPVGLPRIPDSDVTRYEIVSTCSGEICSFELRALNAAGEVMPYNDLGFVTCRGGTRPPSVTRVSELRVSAADCSFVSIKPVASGLIYAPEGRGFDDDRLDLSLPTDITVVPPADPS
jgi:hypothetical protein